MPDVKYQRDPGCTSNADEYQRPLDTANPNRSAAFLHPLKEDSCLAVVGEDLGAGNLAFGHSLFTVVRACLMNARDIFNISSFEGDFFDLTHIILTNTGLTRSSLFQRYLYFNCHGLNGMGHEPWLKD